MYRAWRPAPALQSAAFSFGGPPRFLRTRGGRGRFGPPPIIRVRSGGGPPAPCCFFALALLFSEWRVKRSGQTLPSPPLYLLDTDHGAPVNFERSIRGRPQPPWLLIGRAFPALVSAGCASRRRPSLLAVSAPRPRMPTGTGQFVEQGGPGTYPGPYPGRTAAAWHDQHPPAPAPHRLATLLAAPHGTAPAARFQASGLPSKNDQAARQSRSSSLTLDTHPNPAPPPLTGNKPATPSGRPTTQQQPTPQDNNNNGRCRSSCTRVRRPVDPCFRCVGPSTTDRA